jgi:Lipoprotein signal peptidase
MPKAIPLTALFATAAGIVIIDQITKGLANAWLIYAQPNPLLPWLNITLHYNEGAAFSFLSDAGGWQRYFFRLWLRLLVLLSLCGCGACLPRK